MHVVVYRCNKLLIIAVEQRIAVARVNTAERVQLLEHGDQRAGASAALVHQLDGTVLQGQHRLDAERAAHNGNGGGQPSALLQMLEAVHHGDDAHPLFELLQHGGDFLRRQALLIAQAHRLTDKQRLSLRGRLRVHDMHLQTDIGGGQMRALVGAGQLLADGDHKDLIPRCGGILIHLHKAGRAGLACTGQFAVLCQADEKFILRHRAVIELGGAVCKGDRQRHNKDAGDGQLLRGQIGGGIGNNTDHGSNSFMGVRQRRMLLTIQ